MADFSIKASPPTSVDRNQFFNSTANLRNYWFPVVPSNELTAKPLGLHLWGDPLILYREPALNVAVALEDLCPHRAAPLSVGRISDARAKLPAARVRQYPVREADEWVWVWPGDPESAEQREPPGVYLAWGRPRDVRPWTGYIDLDIDHSLLVENFLDPAHLPFTHDTTISKRANATSLTIKDVHFSLESVKGTQVTPERPDLPGVQFEFRPPCLVALKFRADRATPQPSPSPPTHAKDPAGDSAPPVKFQAFDQTFYAIPTRKGHCRFIYFQRMPFIPDPAAALWSYVPPLKWMTSWYLHRFNKRVLLEDYALLKGVQKNLRWGAKAIDKRTAAPADTIVMVYRDWWRKMIGAGQVWFAGYSSDIEDIHLDNCNTCGD
ncbi:hypothetical protein PhCBS80983_g03717 [Powellomyces hirtus]|uniref:Rieske domain-containing protein n=1 Tax=Powellomyces hirtus TaxID=109895 RepID=A0A507E2I9_9FUNG|nr:hypothetical protein PhCBS80983_g03717 [Powellomyces hirtus]